MHRLFKGNKRKDFRIFILAYPSFSSFTFYSAAVQVLKQINVFVIIHRLLDQNMTEHIAVAAISKSTMLSVTDLLTTTYTMVFTVTVTLLFISVITFEQCTVELQH